MNNRFRAPRKPILLDEWQNVPAVLTAVRRAVDADPRPNRFYVTGSVRAEIENATWPATGRLVRLAVHPMTIGEQLGRVAGPTSLVIWSLTHLTALGSVPECCCRR